MVKIFEKHQQVNKIDNYQTRIIQHESFEDYLQNIDMPNQQYEISYKHVNHEDKIVTFIIEVLTNSAWVEYTHFAQVIGE
jgi:predicted acetyltransferase